MTILHGWRQAVPCCLLLKLVREFQNIDLAKSAADQLHSNGKAVHESSGHTHRGEAGKVCPMVKTSSMYMSVIDLDVSFKTKAVFEQMACDYIDL